MINSYERFYPNLAPVADVTCSKTKSCFNAGTELCSKCLLLNKDDNWLMFDNYNCLKPVGAVIDGRIYPVLHGWFLSKEHGLVSRGTYLGTDGERVTVGGSRYFKVILPDSRSIEILPAT
jgi:hypothetical protein